ncbi:MAG: hypothetical protein Q7T90_12975 [Thiobacillus sp.]|nr:hypothetical protein [Thiobacillus sp.]
MNSLLWQLRQWGRRLGVVGLLGSALLVLALGLLFSLVKPLEHQARQQQQQLDQLRAAALSVPAEPIVATPNPVAMLPPDSSAASAVGELEQLARAHGFELTRGQYSVAAVNGVALARWQMVFQVRADYSALHAFMAAALERLPNLVLDEIKLKRERIEDPELQSELRFGLFVETAP